MVEVVQYDEGVPVIVPFELNVNPKEVIDGLIEYVNALLYPPLPATGVRPVGYVVDTPVSCVNTTLVIVVKVIAGGYATDKLNDVDVVSEELSLIVTV